MMIEDTLTVLWKESKGLLRYNSKRGRSLLILITPIAIFGVIFPIQFRQEWLTSYWSLGVAVFTPLMLIATTVAESFAGERERHTLETLLASRLPDQAILLGKLFASMLFGWGMTVLLLLISLTVANGLEWHDSFQIYAPEILWMDFAASLLISGLVANLGILISLRSSTVQSAAQSIMLALFMPLLLLQAVVFLLPSFIPVDLIKARLEQVDFEAIVITILLALMVVNIGLFLGARVRFKRASLIH
ncbi:MAG: ABC transporter permease subunit [Anaerolineales bacterium]|nr:ABC transporter permease subunit [Anaerolineales bacterium]